MHPLRAFLGAALISATTLSSFAQGTAFTYQGRLNDGTNSASGIYDLRFTIYDLASSGTQQGGAVTNAATAISNGLFTVTLDFGNQFPGADRWLEIGVRTNGGGAFATLSPRQQITSTPYAIQAGNASNAAVAVVATTANSVAAVNVTGTLAEAQLPANVALRAGGNFFTGNQSISGGVLILHANPKVLSANLDWSSVFEFSDITGGGFRSFVGMDGAGLYGIPNQMYLGTYTSHPLSLFTGNQPRMTIDTGGNVGIGTSSPGAKLEVNGSVRGASFEGDGGGLTSLRSDQLTSIGNANGGGANFFVGPSGNATTSGFNNTATGLEALANNMNGSYNTADGRAALYSNTNGSENTAIGVGALYSNTSGLGNTANGSSTLYNNTSSPFNTANGYGALYYNTGSNNIALGALAGAYITTGNSNIAIGNEGFTTDNNLIRIGSGQAQTFIAGVINGNGSGLTGLNPSQLTNGTLPNAVLSSNVSLLGQTIESSEITDGTISNIDISISAAIADTKLATISTAGKVANSALSNNVSLLGQTIESSEITDGTISNLDISISAAIAYSKLNLTNGIVNADINANAAIADTKLATISTADKVANSALSNNVSLLGQTIESSDITDGTISNIDISISAAIAYSKLNLTNGIVNADINTNAAIADTKLATISTAGKVANSALSNNVSLLGLLIESSEIADGTISNIDISISAAIADTKLATISTAGKVANSALSNNVSLLGQTIESSDITDGTISNIDISISAAIADTKLATISTAGKVSDSALSSNVALRSGGNTFSGNQIITNGTIYNYGGEIFRPAFPGWAASTEWDSTNDTSGVRAIVGTDGTGITGTPNQMFVGTYSPHPIAFHINAIRRMTIDTNGNVGIGTATPASRLTVSTPSSTPGLEHTDGTRRVQTYLDSSGAWIRTASTNDKLILACGPSGLPGVTIVHTNVEAIGLDQQHVGINELNPKYTLDVFGDIRVLMAFKPGGGSWTTTSDLRLKKDVRPLAGALDKLLALHGVTFEYIEPEKIRELSGERMGLIAQEVEKVFPDWVETGRDGYKRVTVRGLEALVPEALRELRDEQNARISEIENEKDAEIKTLQHRLDKLERLLSEKHGSAK